MDFAEIVDQLYALDPSEFTAERDARAAQTRKAGDRATADAIKALHRPSPAAWAVNLLARDQADELSRLLELGARLREAQASLSADDLRQLSRQRQEVVVGLARQAVALAAGRGRPISDSASRQVEETLVAALADPDAGAAVASGRLERTLAYSGLGPVDLEQAVAGPPPEPAPVRRTSKKAAGQKSATAPDGQELATAEEEVSRAAAAVDQARARRDQARTEHDAAEDGQAAVESEVARLEGELGAARRSLVAAKGRSRAAARSRETAEAAFAAAERQADGAADRLAKLRRRKS